MTGFLTAQTGRKLALATAFAALMAAPVLAQGSAALSARAQASAQAPQVIAPQAQAPQIIEPRVQMAQARPPNPVSNPFAALLGKSGSALTPEQRAIVDRVDNYLSNMQVLSGKFVQVGPDGRRTQGTFYISKPGKVRFEYDDPSPIELIADGSSVVVRDRNLATQDVYPLSQTPLRFLLSNHVDLMKGTSLVAVYSDDVFVTVVVEEKNGLIGTSRLMMMFAAKDMQLKQWTVTDPQGYDTTVAVYNLNTTQRPDPSMFKIDYTRYHN